MFHNPSWCVVVAQVWVGQYLYAEVAIKVMQIDRDEGFDEVAWRRFKLEVDLQRLLSHHPNIVRFIGACYDYMSQPVGGDQRIFCCKPCSDIPELDR